MDDYQGVTCWGTAINRRPNGRIQAMLCEWWRAGVRSAGVPDRLVDASGLRLAIVASTWHTKSVTPASVRPRGVE